METEFKHRGVGFDETHVLNSQKLSLAGLNLIRLDLPQKEQFVSGIGVRRSREALLVEWIDAEGRSAYGECSCRPDPYYSSEFLDGAIHLIQHFLFRQLKETKHFGDLQSVFGRVRGWEFTKAAVEMAAFQLVTQENDEANPVQPVLDRVPVGISMGIQTDPEVFAGKVSDAIAEGYQRLKFKISPISQFALFEAVIPMLQAAGAYVSFDANGSFTPEHFDLLNQFVQAFPDAAIEQPFPPERYDILLAGKERIPQLRICFDEEIRSIGDLIKLHRLGVVDEVNLKPGRVGGLRPSLAIMDYCAEHGLPCWVGGMFETGIGRVFNLRIAGCLKDARAHDLSPSDRYFAEDIVAPPIRMEDGHVLLEGLEACQPVPELIEKYTTEKIALRY